MITPGHLLVDRELRGVLGGAVRAAAGAPAASAACVQPASIDLRLGPWAYRMRCGFLPGRVPIEERVESLSTARVSLEGGGSVLERGQCYLVPLDDELDLPADLAARFNPRSSTGRCDVFTRVLCPGHARFDEAPAGYAGRPWLEVVPLSFPVRVARGDRLAQMRLVRGRARLDARELEALYARTPLCFVREEEGEAQRALALDELAIDPDGGLLLSLALSGRDPAGWRATESNRVLEFAAEGVHAPEDFFEPVHAPGGQLILLPGSFYVFASRERLRIPPSHAAEMQPVDVGIGELRNNYAGFFDNGFGWQQAGERPRERGTPAVLEVRAHDVPFLVEDGQVFFRLTLFRTSGRPDRLYGQGRASYADQDLTLARCFRAHGAPDS